MSEKNHSVNDQNHCPIQTEQHELYYKASVKFSPLLRRIAVVQIAQTRGSRISETAVKNKRPI